MFTKSNLLLAAALTLTIASDIRSQIEAKKAAKLYLDAHEAFEMERAANEAQIAYLCHMLNESDVEPNEFDLIVLNFNQ